MIGPALGEGVSAGGGGRDGPGVGCCQIGITVRKIKTTEKRVKHRSSRSCG